MKNTILKLLAVNTSITLVLATGYSKIESSIAYAYAKTVTETVTETSDIMDVSDSITNIMNDLSSVEKENETLPEEAETTPDERNSDNNNHYIVVTSGEKGDEEVKSYAEEHDLLDEEDKQYKLDDQHIFTLTLDNEDKENIENIAGVESIEKDWSMTANEEVPVDENLVDEIVSTNTEVEFNQWYLDAISLPNNESNTGDKTTTGAAILSDESKNPCSYTGKGVKVAVLDSGVSYLEDVNVVERVDFVEDSEESNVLFDDASGHGTGIAGVISADAGKGSLQGIAPDVDIYSVRILDVENQAPVSRVIEGIYWCIDNRIDIINMSFGMSHYSEALEMAVQAADNAGIVMIGAAGNQGESSDQIEYPAAYSEVIAVGASDGNNTRTAFTPDSDDIDILAPGEKIWAYSVFQGIMAVDGTSVATAQVTGAVALLLEKNDSMNQIVNLRQLLATSASKVSNQQSMGVLNIREALSSLDSFEDTDGEYPQKKIYTVSEYDTDGIVTGCWAGNTHESTVTACSGTYIAIAGKTARVVDTNFSTKKGYGVIHGQHNYVANLHYLYYFARHYENGSMTRGVCADSAASASAHKEDSYYGANDYKDLKEIITNLWDGNDHVKDGDSYYTVDTRSKKTWAVIGVAAHLIADTFAHRSMVPKNYTFTSTTYFSDAGRKELNTQTSKSVIEFRDIKSYKKSGVKSKDINPVYEDNTNFYNGRFNASKRAVSQLIADFKASDAYDIVGIMKKANPSEILNNLSNYTNSAGYSGSSLSSYSTDKYMYNYVGNSFSASDGDWRDYSHYSYC